MRHVAEDGEGDRAGQQARGRVHQARDHGVPGGDLGLVDNICLILLLDTVVVELVVAAQGGQGASADGVGKEDLRGGVDPTFGRVKF